VFVGDVVVLEEVRIIEHDIGAMGTTSCQFLLRDPDPGASTSDSPVSSRDRQSRIPAAKIGRKSCPIAPIDCSMITDFFKNY